MTDSSDSRSFQTLSFKRRAWQGHVANMHTAMHERGSNGCLDLNTAGVHGPKPCGSRRAAASPDLLGLRGRLSERTRLTFTGPDAGGRATCAAQPPRARGLASYWHIGLSAPPLGNPGVVELLAVSGFWWRSKRVLAEVSFSRPDLRDSQGSPKSSAHVFACSCYWFCR